MKHILFIVLLFTITVELAAQNVFPKKLDNCTTGSFCLDCGDVKANVDEKKLKLLVKQVESKNNLRGIKGIVKFQIIVDSTGKGCVLSHTDVSNLPISRSIVTALNNFNGYTPATSQGKAEPYTSFNMAIEIKDGAITAQVERVDVPAFLKSFDRPASPEVYNKDYVYKNENLNRYKITVWNANNSNLSDHWNDHIAIDKSGIVWLTIQQGLVSFDGKSFKDSRQNITKEEGYVGYYEIEADNNNVKWIYTQNNIYSFDNVKWTKYDSADIGINGAYSIINNPKTSEVFFGSDEGLTIYSNGKWTNINKDKVKELPSNRVAFAKRDSKNRIWIGTFSGSVMIDENGKATSFNETETVLKDKCITSMDEDENGNIYFGLYEFDRKVPSQVNNDEGIAILSTDGTMKQYTTSNSGMPFNHVSKVLYDKNEKVLWIATARAGLVRYDLNGNWENYHSDNSDIPTSYIADMAFDNNGVLHLATRQGLVRLERIKE